MVDYKFKRKPRGTHCSNGHEFTQENTFTRAYDNARVCRECRKQYAREKYQRNKDKNGGTSRIKRASTPIFELLESSQISDNAIEHWDALQDGMRENATNCMDMPEFYADKSIEVSVDKAEEMCYGCPVFQLCHNFAVAAEVNAGIWAGLHYDQDEGLLFNEEDMNGRMDSAGS